MGNTEGLSFRDLMDISEQASIVGGSPHLLASLISLAPPQHVDMMDLLLLHGVRMVHPSLLQELLGCNVQPCHGLK